MVLFSEGSLKDIKYSHLKNYDYEDYLEFLIFYDYYFSKYQKSFFKKGSPKYSGNLSRIYRIFSNILNNNISCITQLHNEGLL